MTQPLNLPTFTAISHIFSHKHLTCDKNKFILNSRNTYFNKVHASLHEAKTTTLPQRNSNYNLKSTEKIRSLSDINEKVNETRSLIIYSLFVTKTTTTIKINLSLHPSSKKPPAEGPFHFFSGALHDQQNNNVKLLLKA